MPRFKSVLSVLSKSSPYAVTTERDSSSQNIFDEVKKRLYIEMPIEGKVNAVISSMSPSKPEVLFLCGSSGDGKSEILTSCKKTYSTRAKFHLDATHSFDPSENAIQTLDKLFNDFQLQESPLVVGINTGMLENYAEQGSNNFFKCSIKAYLDKGTQADGMYFINFEDYPKFNIDESGYSSEFAEKLIKKLTASDDNLIRQLFDKDKLEYSDPESRLLQANYELLSIPVVQRSIIELLFKARLMRDQFLTARALLDFIFMLLAGPGYLFDNLFSGGDNELASKIVEFDPAHLRTKNVDRFILSNDLGLPDTQFDDFKAHLSQLGIDNLSNSYSYLRLFYVLKDGEFANNYHAKFLHDFNESLIEEYIDIYQKHRDFDNGSEHKKELKSFYNNILRAAVRRYNNRNSPKLDKNQYLISERNGYQLVAKLDIKADLKNITNHPYTSPSNFTACIKVGGECLTIPVNINLLRMMKSIVDGYRPNKHDKNSVVLLDELIEKIAQVANSEVALIIIKGQKQITVEKIDDDEFEVSGI